ncbi:hypothetical protein WJ972_12835 [Achromobacter insuavis]
MILELSRMVRETTSSAQMQDALKRLSAQSGHTGYISVLEGRDVMVLHVQQAASAARHDLSRTPFAQLGHLDRPRAAGARR